MKVTLINSALYMDVYIDMDIDVDIDIIEANSYT